MTGAIARMRTLRGRIALVRNGLGAAVLPADVKSLALDFAAKINGGHMGPRKFWRQFLPRLKFHNPEVEMSVNQRKEIGGLATLTVLFEGDRKKVIDCQNKHESDIVKQLIDLTQAGQLPINDHDSMLANEYLTEKERAKNALKTRLAKRAAKKEEDRLNDGLGVA